MKSLRKKNTPLDELYSRITENTEMMDDLQKSLEKQQQHFFTTSLHSKAIAESLKKYSDVSSTYNSRIPLSDCMQRASEWQGTLGEVFSHLGNVMYDRTTQPLKETIKIQIDMAKDGKKRLKKVGESSGGKQQQQSEFKKEQEALEKLTKETQQLYNDSELALENSAVQTVLSAYEAYYDFFQKGAFQMSRIKSEIDNYRKIILETNKVAAKLRNYIPRKTFGIKLEEVFAREAHRPIPLFLEELFKYLEKVAPTVEGIFRVSAGKSAIDALQQKIETNQPLDLPNSDPHAVSSVLKSFFRSLPEPVIFYSNYQKYLPLSSQPQNTHIPELKRLISSLPVSNQIVLKNVLGLCSLVKQHKDVTKMDLNNLAVVIGPNLMESIPGLKAEDIQKAETFAEFNSLFVLLVENYQFIFPSHSNADFSRSRAQTESALQSSVGTPSPPPIQKVDKPLPTPPVPVNNNQSNISSSNFTQPTKPPIVSNQSPTIPTTNTPTTTNIPVIVNELSLSTISISDPSDVSTQTHSDEQTEAVDVVDSNQQNITNALVPPSPSILSDSPISPSSPPTPISSSTSTSTNTLSSPMSDYQQQRKKTVSAVMIRGDAELLKPIDMEIHFINIHSNLERLKSIVQNTTSTEYGIHLIKSFKKISEISVTIQKITKYNFNRDKPIVNADDDRIVKVQKTLVYTYENNVDLVMDAKKLYESSEDDIELCKELENVIESMDKCLINELSILNDLNQ